MATLYGSVSGASKKISKLYGSVNDQTKEIKKLYGSVNGLTKLIYESGATPTVPEWGELVCYGFTYNPTVLSNVTGGTVTILDEESFKDIFTDSGTYSAPIDVTITGSDPSMAWDWTVTATSGGQQIYVQTFMLESAISLTSSDSPFTISFTISSFLNITIDTSTTTTRRLQSQTEYESTCVNGGSNTLLLDSIPKSAVKEFTFGTNVTSAPNFCLANFSNLDTIDLSLATSMTSIGDYFLSGCAAYNSAVSLPSSVTSIGIGFLYNVPNFNSAVTLPSGLQSIGNQFLYGCNSFNQALSLPNGLKTIGNSFLHMNPATSQPTIAFNQPLVLPSSLTSIGNYFMAFMQSMTTYVDVGSLNATIAATSNNTLCARNTSAASYTTGIKIKGANRSAWMSRFPNRTSNPYRTLVNYGS